MMLRQRNCKKCIRTMMLILIVLFSAAPAKAQRIGLKTNALYWATATPNLGVEFRVNRHLTMNFEGAVNRLNVGKFDTKAVVFNPELRYWFSARPQAGHFVGVTGVVADYNIVVSDKRHKGDAAGVGIAYGYSFVLSRHWSLETTVGVGGLYRHEKSSKTSEPEPDAVNVKKWQAAPLKAGVTFVYIIK